MKRCRIIIFFVGLLVQSGLLWGAPIGETANSRCVTEAQRDVRIVRMCEKKLRTRMEAYVDEKFATHAAYLGELAKEHISFLTDKSSFLSVLLTFVSTMFGLIGVFVTIFAGYKVTVWRSQMKKLGERFDQAVADWEAREKSLRLDSLHTYGIRIRDASLQYKALNVMTFPPTWSTAMATMRQSLLNSFIDCFGVALVFAREVNRPSAVVKLMTRLASMEAELKKANGSADAQFIKTHRMEINKPCESADLKEFVKKEKIKPATLAWYLRSYEDFYKRFI